MIRREMAWIIKPKDLPTLVSGLPLISPQARGLPASRLPALVPGLPLISPQARGHIATHDVIQLTVADLAQFSFAAIYHEFPPQI
jgi:hypothetical protein